MILLCLVSLLCPINATAARAVEHCGAPWSTVEHRGSRCNPLAYPHTAKQGKPVLDARPLDAADEPALNVV